MGERLAWLCPSIKKLPIKIWLPLLQVLLLIWVSCWPRVGLTYSDKSAYNAIVYLHTRNYTLHFQWEHKLHKMHIQYWLPNKSLICCIVYNFIILKLSQIIFLKSVTHIHHKTIYYIFDVFNKSAFFLLYSIDRFSNCGWTKKKKKTLTNLLSIAKVKQTTFGTIHYVLTITSEKPSFIFPDPSLSIDLKVSVVNKRQQISQLSITSVWLQDT